MEIRCRDCKSPRMIKNGTQHRLKKGRKEVVYQNFLCKNCGASRAIKIKG